MCDCVGGCAKSLGVGCFERGSVYLPVILIAVLIMDKYTGSFQDLQSLDYFIIIIILRLLEYYCI